MSFISNSQELATTQMPNSCRMSKYIVSIQTMECYTAIKKKIY